MFSEKQRAEDPFFFFTDGAINETLINPWIGEKIYKFKI